MALYPVMAVLAAIGVLGIALTVVVPAAAPVPAFACTLLVFGVVRSRVRRRNP